MLLLGPPGQLLDGPFLKDWKARVSDFIFELTHWKGNNIGISDDGFLEDDRR